jgi:hypothetical protein
MNIAQLAREAFEKWHKSEYQGHNSYDYKHDTTAYIDDYVEMAWQAWQAAMELKAQASEPVAQISVDKDSFKYVEWLVDNPMHTFSRGTKFYTSPPNTQQKLDKAITALQDIKAYEYAFTKRPTLSQVVHLARETLKEIE